MKYSILMSVYFKDKPEWLKIAFDSILAQTVAADEIVLVKDGKLTPELDDIIHSYSDENPGLFVVIPLEKNIGLGLALREGILHCKNELIARMDSDDYIVPNRCEKLLSIYEKNYEYDCVGSYEAEFEYDISNVVAEHKVPETSEEIYKFMRRRCALLHPTVMYKKQAVLDAGNYNDIRLFEDYDLFIRMVIENGARCYNIPECLYYIRINNDFYKRRGGWNYMRTVVRFKNQQRKKCLISNMDFIISAGGQTIICLMPNKIRRWFYMKYLR